MTIDAEQAGTTVIAGNTWVTGASRKTKVMSSRGATKSTLVISHGVIVIKKLPSAFRLAQSGLEI